MFEGVQRESESESATDAGIGMISWTKKRSLGVARRGDATELVKVDLAVVVEVGGSDHQPHRLVRLVGAPSARDGSRELLSRDLAAQIGVDSVEGDP